MNFEWHAKTKEAGLSPRERLWMDCVCVDFANGLARIIADPETEKIESGRYFCVRGTRPEFQKVASHVLLIMFDVEDAGRAHYSIVNFDFVPATSVKTTLQ